jgi:hypothetical protein
MIHDHDSFTTLRSQWRKRDIAGGALSIACLLLAIWVVLVVAS